MKTIYTLTDFSTIMTCINMQMNIENFNKATPKKDNSNIWNFKIYKQSIKALQPLGNYSDIDISLYLSKSKMNPIGLWWRIYENTYLVKAHINIENWDYKTNLKWIYEQKIESEDMELFFKSKSLKDIKWLKKFIKEIKEWINIFA